MAENKVSFNLKNVHYSILTESVSSGVVSYTWAAPVAVAGAVSLSLDAKSESNKFYADGCIYYTSIANNGYEGDLEMARFPDQMMQDIWGYSVTATDKVLVESNSSEAKAFALLFQIDGDSESEYYCMLNCKATKPNVGGATIEDTKEPSTKSCTITAAPLADGRIMARTTAETTSSVKSGWFSATSWGVQ